MVLTKVKGHKVVLDKGSVEIDGSIVGSLNKEFKHGYHPAALLKVRDKVEWFELDDKDIVNKAANKAVEFYFNKVVR